MFESTVDSQGKEDFIKGYEFYILERYQESIPYFQLAAEKGHAHAQFYLGSLYLNGDGVEQDIEKGSRLIEWAVDLGYAKAQYCLGKIFIENGGFLEENDIQAEKLFLSAFELGYEKQKSLNKCYWILTRHAFRATTDVESAGKCHQETERLCLLLLELDSRKEYGVYESCLNVLVALGNNRLSGPDFQKDIQEAVRILQLAVELGNLEDALPLLYKIAKNYKVGAGVEKNVEEARRIFEFTAEKGFEPSRNALLKFDDPEYLPLDLGSGRFSVQNIALTLWGDARAAERSKSESESSVFPSTLSESNSDEDANERQLDGTPPQLN